MKSALGRTAEGDLSWNRPLAGPEELPGSGDDLRRQTAELGFGVVTLGEHEGVHPPV